MSARVATGADLLCAGLEAAGVECVFGVPGTQSVPLYEALRRAGHVRSVVATHELAASFMANGYARASGRVAPLLTIPGPGFTYALTGVAEARHDSVPLVLVAGAPPPGERPFGFQALDQRAIVAPMVKAVLRAERPEEVRARLAQALAVAAAGEPGPVYLEWTSAALGPLRGDPEPAAAADPAPPAPERLAEVVSAVLAARRPLLLVGQGCAASAGLVRSLAEGLSAPVLTTGSGRGTLAEDHPLALAFDFARGRLGALNTLLREADLVLALGAKLSSAGTSLFQVEIPPGRLVHVDAGEGVAGATYEARLAVTAPVEPVLRALLEALGARPRAPAWSTAEVAAARERLRAGDGEGLAEPVFHGVAPGTAKAFFAALRRALPPGGFVVADSGLHQFLLRRHFDVLAPRGLLMPSDFQSMGYAIPAAIGARLAAPSRPAVAIVGDGGFAMSGMELLTAVRERVRLTVVVFNDGRLNLIRLSQLALSGRSEGTDLVNPDFQAFAEAVGARFARVDGDPEGVLRAAIESTAVTLVEVLLGDSPAIARLRAKGRVRAAATSVVGSGALGTLKRLVGR